MIQRFAETLIQDALDQFPAVVILGTRQVGKTTLARSLARSGPSIYLDLESETDRRKLSEPALYLAGHHDKLVVMDEVQRMPGLFEALRGVIDSGRRAGLRSGRFLLLGSATGDLLRQTGESLAGRVAYVELGPFDFREVEFGLESQDRLWLRGGFPESYLAVSDRRSLLWRRNFLRTYLERELPMLGLRLPEETLRRLWTMLAHQQGGLLNVAELGRALSLDAKTVRNYLDVLVDLMLVRRLQPWHANVGKRLVRSPKVYIRDSGLLHSLLGIADYDSLLGHPIGGRSWEGMVIESLYQAGRSEVGVHFYRTSGGAEIDLVLDVPGSGRWAVEIKRSLAPKVEKGFHVACSDLGVARRYVAYPGEETYPLGGDVLAINPRNLAAEIAQCLI